MKIIHEFGLVEGLIASTRWLNLDHYQDRNGCGVTFCKSQS